MDASDGPRVPRATSPIRRVGDPVRRGNTTFKVTASTSVSWLVTFSSSDPNVVGSVHCESTNLTINN